MLQVCLASMLHRPFPHPHKQLISSPSPLATHLQACPLTYLSVQPPTYPLTYLSVQPPPQSSVYPTPSRHR